MITVLKVPSDSLRRYENKKRVNIMTFTRLYTFLYKFTSGTRRFDISIYFPNRCRLFKDIPQPLEEGVTSANYNAVRSKLKQTRRTIEDEIMIREILRGLR